MAPHGGGGVRRRGSGRLSSTAAGPAPFTPSLDLRRCIVVLKGGGGRQLQVQPHAPAALFQDARGSCKARHPWQQGTAVGTATAAVCGERHTAAPGAAWSCICSCRRHCTGTVLQTVLTRSATFCGRWTDGEHHHRCLPCMQTPRLSCTRCCWPMASLRPGSAAKACWHAPYFQGCKAHCARLPVPAQAATPAAAAWRRRHAEGLTLAATSCLDSTALPLRSSAPMQRCGSLQSRSIEQRRPFSAVPPASQRRAAAAAPTGACARQHHAACDTASLSPAPKRTVDAGKPPALRRTAARAQDLPQCCSRSLSRSRLLLCRG